jgi:hypothetical protein
MDGRVMFELLANSKESPVTVKKEILSTEVKDAWGTYELQLERSVMGKYQYVNFSKVKRVVASASVGKP